MTLQLLTAPDESLLGHAAAGLRLRLADHAGESHVVEVREAKCTIGTAASCTLRLPEKPASRLDPMQCFILRGHAQTVVRRLSPDVRLNGREFTDAVLHIGDRLAIGNYEIEVLPPAKRGAEPPRESERLDSILMAERAAWQTERGSLRAELDGARAEIERLAAEGQMQLARHQQTQSNIAQLQAELQQAWDVLEEDRQRWQIERQQQHAELSQKTAALTAAVRQSSHLETALIQANDRAAQQAAEAKAAAARSAESQNALARAQATLSQQTSRFEADRLAWQEERELRLAESRQMSLTVAAAVEASSRWQDELARLSERTAQLTADDDTRAARQAAAEQTIEQLTAELADAQRQLQEAQKERRADRDSLAELAESVDKALRLEAELSQANDRLEKLAEQLDAQTADRRRLHEALEIAETERAEATASLEQERAHWQAQLDAAATNPEAPEFATAIEECARLHAELSRAEQQIADLNQALEQAATEREQTQAAFHQQSTVWQAQQDAQAAELSQQSSDLTAAIDQLSHLSLAFAEANAQVRQLTSDIDRQTERARESQAVLEQLRAELDQARAAYNERQGEESLRQAGADVEFERAIEELRGELETTRTSLARERGAWEDERRLHQLDRDAVEAEATSRSAILQQRLTDLTCELAAARKELDEERAEWQQLLANQQLEAEQQLAELRAEAAAAVVKAPDVPEQQNASRPEQIEPSEEANLSTESNELPEADTSLREYGQTAAEAEPAATHPSADGQFAQTDDLLAQFATAEQELAFELPSSEAPVTTADLLSRFGLSIQHDGTETSTAEPMKPRDAASQPVTGAPAQHANTATEPHHDEQDSIDAYMAQLMARLGRSTYSPPREEEPQTREVVEEEEPSHEVVAPAVEIQGEPKLRDPSEMARRAHPPELSADLSAMREIANLNARAAIDTHVRRNLLEAWISKAAVMVLGLGAAGTETWFAMEGNETASYFIVPCLMVAIFWGWQYLTMSKRLNQNQDEVVEGEAQSEARDEG